MPPAYVVASFAKLLVLLASLEVGRTATIDDQRHLSLLILHNNDMHARFEQTARDSGRCTEQTACVGGFARTAHEVRRYRRLADEGKGPKVLFLNAGDIFVGTEWYGAYKGKICADFINILKPDVICLGNHEFDEGLPGLLPFIDNLTVPVVTSNLEYEPATLEIKNSIVFDIDGHKIGVIGVLTQDTMFLARPQPVVVTDEIEAVRKESERLDREGVKIIIVLAHSGFFMEKRIAKELPLVDIVVGGHTNTFLWNGPQLYEEKPEGPYPVVVKQISGKKVPVVQAYAYTKYLGRLNVTFDSDGDLVEFSGQPELLNSEIPEDQDVLDLLDYYRPKVKELFSEIVAQSKVYLDGQGEHCRKFECNFGNLVTDAFVYYIALKTNTKESWTAAPIALYNAGNLRNSINVTNTGGNITKGELYSALPYINTIIYFQILGSDLLEALEWSVHNFNISSGGEFLQLSGVHVVYDMKNPPGQRVASVEVRCQKCLIPKYHPLNLTEVYTVITTDYLLDGGDGYGVLKEKSFNKTASDMAVFETVNWYLRKNSPVYPEIEGRIKFIKDSGVLAKASALLVSGCVLVNMLTKVLATAAS